jgi:hypothetical protein
VHGLRQLLDHASKRIRRSGDPMRCDPHIDARTGVRHQAWLDRHPALRRHPERVFNIRARAAQLAKSQRLRWHALPVREQVFGQTRHEGRRGRSRKTHTCENLGTGQVILVPSAVRPPRPARATGARRSTVCSPGHRELDGGQAPPLDSRGRSAHTRWCSRRAARGRAMLPGSATMARRT